MKPAPPKKLDFELQSYRIISTPSIFNPHKHENGVTTLAKASDPENVLWQFEDYVGKRSLLISPNGEELLLFGNEYFGHIISQGEGDAILTHISRSGSTKEWKYSEITGQKLIDDLKKYNLAVFGGGWVDISKILILKQALVDWGAQSLTFKYKGQKKTLVFNFKTETNRQISKEEAHALVRQELLKITGDSKDKMTVDKARTQKKNFGWVFYSIGQDKFERGGLNSSIPGIGPIVVTHSGAVEFLTTSIPPQKAIEMFEKSLSGKSERRRLNFKTDD